MTESTVGWFSVREKYYSLADKPWLISRIRPSEQADYSLNLEYGLRSIKENVLSP